ncbi:hypothetical protein JW935_28920 [candidate division KSB1 bacterium]|nr:hypothetical protein [candidate division KSB1 bacterium]
MKILAKLLFFLPLLFFCSEPLSETKHVPEITKFSLSRTQLFVREYIDVQASIKDVDKSDKHTFLWSADGGRFTNANNNPTQWHAPEQPGDFIISLQVSDGFFRVDTSATVKVLAAP